LRCNELGRRLRQGHETTIVAVRRRSGLPASGYNMSGYAG
jgi:hypothetical protein